ncbi:hypothetical protein LX32DRAFT_279360 [Colletotrichum zoysiae]|uniref:Uncharacterized protein n=1 Tax=Colletotrichum zoysiae TaxID=1216348 RepID=A0AAD9M7B5_9PEZI|nr:hypothetical protein LX32DRAFT_279360 [Colletotrichum zoysiae]
MTTSGRQPQPSPDQTTDYRLPAYRPTDLPDQTRPDQTRPCRQYRDSQPASHLNYTTVQHRTQEPLAFDMAPMRPTCLSVCLSLLCG